MQASLSGRHTSSTCTYEARHRRNYRGYVPEPDDEVAHVSANTSPDELWERFISQRRPCVIDGFIQDVQFKHTDWTDLDRLRQRAGSSRVKIEPLHATGRFGTSMKRQKVPFALYLAMMQDPELASSYYLTTQYQSEGEDESDGQSDEEVQDAEEDPIAHRGAETDRLQEASRLKRRRSATPEEDVQSDIERRPRKRNDADDVAGRRASHTSASSALQTLSPSPGSSSTSGSSAPTSYTADPAVEELDPPLPPPMAALAEGLPLPVPEILGGLVLQQCNMWMGACTEPKSSGLHHDHHDNLYMLLSGRKRFLLWPPIAHFWLHPRGRLESMHQNGLLTYVPRGELPTWHSASTRQQLRADGLPEVEAAHWRVKARERALEEANERAAQLAGEAHRPANRRKGKGKQTAEQVLALERLAAARVQQEYVRHSESGESFLSRDSDSEVGGVLGERTAAQAVSPSILRRALIAPSDAESTSASADDEDLPRSTHGSLRSQSNIEKMHYDGIAAPFVAHALASGETRSNLPALVPRAHRKSDGTRDDSSDVSDASMDQRQLNALFLEPLLRAMRRAGDNALDLDAATGAIRQGYQAVGLTSEGLSLEDDSDDSEDSDGSELVSRSSPPLHIPRGMLPGGLLGRPDGTGAGEEHEFEEYDDYLAEADFDVQTRDIEIMLGTDSRATPTQGLVGENGEDDERGLDEALFAAVQAQPERREALLTRLREIAAESALDGTPSNSESHEEDFDEDSEESELDSDTDKEDAEAMLRSSAEEHNAVRESHLVRQLKYGLAKGELGFLDQVMDDAREFCAAQAADHLPISNDLRILIAAALQLGAMNGDPGDDDDEATTTPEGIDETDEESRDGPNSFSLIDPRALHAYFGIPDDPSQDARTPQSRSALADLPPEALGPRAGCPAPLVVDLKPGQTLYLPVSWWHEVTSWSDETSGGVGTAQDTGELDGGGSVVPHQAISWWVHPPTALKEGIALPPLWCDEDEKTSPAETDEEKNKSESGAGSAGSAKASSSLPSGTRTVGTSAQPYVDFEVWDEIRRAVDVLIKQSRSDAAREAMKASADEGEEEDAF